MLYILPLDYSNPEHKKKLDANYKRYCERHPEKIRAYRKNYYETSIRYKEYRSTEEYKANHRAYVRKYGNKVYSDVMNDDISFLKT